MNFVPLYNFLCHQVVAIIIVLLIALNISEKRLNAIDNVSERLE